MYITGCAGCNGDDYGGDGCSRDGGKDVGYRLVPVVMMMV